MISRWKLSLAATALLLAGAFETGVPLRPAAAGTDIDVSVFYTSLAPHGEWVRIESYGWAWVPQHVDYGWRPYTVGQWSWVEPYGWTWVSDEPWGWATYHYGRWTYVDDYGWAWVPGTTWAPAWVVFRYGDPWVGWAPRPPGSTWRFDESLDVAGLNVDVVVGTYAWTFVSLRYFAEPDLRVRLAVSSYNPYLVQRTRWSTRYATVEGGVANRSVDVAAVEKARGAPVPRRRLEEAPAPEPGSGARIRGDAVVVYRPRVAPAAVAQPPPQRLRGEGDGPGRGDIDAWTAQRRAALKAHVEAQRKALEQPDDLPAVPAQPSPGGAADDDAAKRRAAAIEALADEQKRLEALLERQRKRREREQTPPAPPPPPAMDEGGHGMKDDGEGMGDDGKGMEDDGKGMK